MVTEIVFMVLAVAPLDPLPVKWIDQLKTVRSSMIYSPGFQAVLSRNPRRVCSVCILAVARLGFLIYYFKIFGLIFDTFFVLFGWWINWINDNLKHFIYHLRYEFFSKLIGRANIWIRINFNQPNSKIFINHKVIPK